MLIGPDQTTWLTLSVNWEGAYVMGSENMDGPRRPERSILSTSELLGDDAEVEMKRKLPDALVFSDPEFVPDLLNGLNTMRNSGHFCDVTLQVGSHSILGHRCVLAVMSQYLAKNLAESTPHRQRRIASGSTSDSQLNGHTPVKGELASDRVVDRVTVQLPSHLDAEALDILVEYVYTGKLFVRPWQVRSLYCAAIYLRMEKVVAVCARWLVDNLDTSSCLEVRAMKGITDNVELVTRVDEFIKDKFEELVGIDKLLQLTQLKVELLTPSLEPMTDEVMSGKALLVLDWLRSSVQDTNNSPLQFCANKLHLLYMNTDNKLHDCTDIHTNDQANTEVVRDYKKFSKKHSTHRAPDLTQVRSSGQLKEGSSTDNDGKSHWTVIACVKTGERGMVALTTVQGQLCVLSLRQRLNTPSPAETPVSSRPPSLEKPDHYAMLPELSGPKCATGVGNLNNKLIICGGYDRGECLRDVELYDPSTNTITPLTPMQAARGRFDLTVLGGRAYAVGGCNGNDELTSVEMYCPGPDSGTWRACAPLTMARSNTGVCALNGRIYCVGGWNGKFGSKKCEVYDPEHDRWTFIASLSIGRYQAAVIALGGLVYAIGGCDSWNCLSSVEAYDPTNDIWVNVPPMSTARRGAGVSVIHNKLIVVGGSDGVKSLSSTEIYDPERREWTAGPKMTSRRANVNVAEIGGKVFAVGGFSGKTFLNTMEYLDSAFMCWSTFVSLRSRGPSGDSDTFSSDQQAESSDSGDRLSTTDSETATVAPPVGDLSTKTDDVILSADDIDGGFRADAVFAAASAQPC